MVDCLDDHIKEKYKICPENVSPCIKKIKTDEFNKSFFYIKL